MIDSSPEKAPAPLTEEVIGKIVEAFYTEARHDPVLGPIFNGHVEDWQVHLDRIKAFWSSIMLGSGRYKGNPFAAHAPLASEIDEAHFRRWLALWSTTVRQFADEDVAVSLEAKAQKIAASLRAGLLFHAEIMDPDRRA
ncbi:group III truncated hemoglobin [Limoniibacter endophyticus]|uniref:Preprotein translocase subunit TatC n=1 Tax=Limoniibacter endophyticus TaxID=1565040 RepID=A0A8J3DMZ1_9HYPH|nr:group III truncated hemoglobin [Limoniibacter endophyticus]GHC72478.1 preprotein translocase subunit TatC [Limoniibacter endophyticus]